MIAIRRATTGDLDACEEILNQAIAYLASQGLSQWQSGYPNRDNIEADFVCGELVVAEDDETGAVVGSASIVLNGDPVYSYCLRGNWINASSDDENASYGCIHRVTCSPEHRGRGVGTALMRELERVSRAEGKLSCRVETHPKNAGMRRVAEKLGYAHCCDIMCLNDRTEGRIAYEKILDPKLHALRPDDISDAPEELAEALKREWARRDEIETQMWARRGLAG